MRLCARAEKSQDDARRLMRGWGLAEREGEQVLARLVRDRFIDDGRYAEAFVRDKLRLSGWGEYKIRTACSASVSTGNGSTRHWRRPTVRIWASGCGSSWNARCGRQTYDTIRTQNQTDTLRAFAGIRLRTVLDAAAALVTDTETCDEFLTLLLFTTICSGAQGQRLNPNDYIYPIRGVAGFTGQFRRNASRTLPRRHRHQDRRRRGQTLVAVGRRKLRFARERQPVGLRGRYLTLGNGTTAVYGHLQRFRGDIESAGPRRTPPPPPREQRRTPGSAPNAWPVAQGDTIGIFGQQRFVDGAPSAFRTARHPDPAALQRRARRRRPPRRRPAAPPCASTTSRWTACRAFPSTAVRRATPSSAKRKAATG